MSAGSAARTRSPVKAAAPRRAAGVVVVCEAPSTPLFLLLRAYRYWDFPKGELRPGESELDAAVREVMEETGIADLQFAWGSDHYRTQPYSGGKTASYFVALTTTRTVTFEVDPQLGRAEHHEYRWVDYAAGWSLLGPRVRAALEWAVRQMV